MTTQSAPIHSTRQEGHYGLMRISGRTLIYLLVISGAVVSMLPFFWTLSSSGKTPQEIYTYPPTFWPANPQFWANYAEIWQIVPFARWFLNTAFVTAVSLIGEVISATLVAHP